jgi:hypothetical protein
VGVTLIVEEDEDVHAVGRAFTAAGGAQKLFGRPVQVIRVGPGEVPWHSAAYGAARAGLPGVIAAGMPLLVAPAPGWELGTVTDRVTVGGLHRAGRARGPDGELRVDYDYQAVFTGDDPGGVPDQYVLTSAEARLDGQLVTDPERARELAAAAGLTPPKMLPPG